jgi:outer membrane lipoprotein SlyB
MAGLPGIQSRQSGFIDKATGLLTQSAQTFAGQDRIITSAEPEKTAGGALMGGLSGAATGAMIGSTFGPGPGTAIGAVGGAIVGIAGYMLS